MFHILHIVSGSVYEIRNRTSKTESNTHNFIDFCLESIGFCFWRSNDKLLNGCVDNAEDHKNEFIFYIEQKRINDKKICIKNESIKNYTNKQEIIIKRENVHIMIIWEFGLPWESKWDKFYNLFLQSRERRGNWHFPKHIISFHFYSIKFNNIRCCV